MLTLSRDEYPTAPAHTLPSSPGFPVPAGIAARADAGQDKTITNLNSNWGWGAAAGALERVQGVI